jgi:hypothetical protein
MRDLLCVLLRIGRTVRYNRERVRVLERSADGYRIVAQCEDGTHIDMPWFVFEGLTYRTRAQSFHYHATFQSRPKMRAAFARRTATSVRASWVANHA